MIIAPPLLAGAVKSSVAVLSPGVMKLIVGAPGTLAGAFGVTLIVPEAGPVPIAFLALMEQE